MILSCVSDALHLDPYSELACLSLFNCRGGGWDSLVPEGGRKHTDVHPPSGLSSFLGRCSLASVRAAGLSDISRHKDKKVACYVCMCVCVCVYGSEQRLPLWGWTRFRLDVFSKSVIFLFCFVFVFGMREEREFFFNWFFSLVEREERSVSLILFDFVWLGLIYSNEIKKNVVF